MENSNDKFKENNISSFSNSKKEENSTNDASVKELNVRKTKRRMSNDFDEDVISDYGESDSDEEDEEDILKRLKTDNLEGGKAVSLEMSDKKEEDLLSLLRDFARLDLPDYYSVEEACPQCDLVMPTVQFADHVNMCIQTLEEQENNAMSAMGAKTARALAQAELGGVVLDEGEQREQQWRIYEQALGRNKKPKPACPAGSACAELNSHHFHAFEHPPAHCPLCDYALPLYEVNAHVSICISTPDEYRLGAQAKKRAYRDIDEQSLPLDTSMRSDNDDDDDDDDDDEHSQEDSDHEPTAKLTVGQLTSIAKMVVEKADEGGQDLFQQLNTFKTQGITRESIEAASKEFKKDAESTNKK